ncbi:MAG TPA: isoaspartyl peptidase/L-asparaginase [Gemmatimonadales bacterium]|nr:isoaspartyl peptidase/L-asparaginase [Gemmatimonadales bacterium]
MADEPISRRSFLGTAGAVAGASALPHAGRGVPAWIGAPAVHTRRLGGPVAVCSSNGLRGVGLAVSLMTKGSDPLDAGIEGVKIQELDPNDQSVGYGGLPNADGVVQIDASCMHGPTKRAGAVGALEGIRTASEVVRMIMKYTPHVMLVGQDAQRFAVEYGFKIEEMLTPASREAWLHWRANLSKDDNYLDLKPNEKVAHTTGTCPMMLLAPNGDMASVVTTSGLAWKVPGRVGDSGIVGAGQYTDNDVGSAGSTGLGEANIMVAGGFQTVDHMRRGLAPKDACLATLKSVMAMTPPRLIDERGRPRYQLQYYAVNKKGEYGAAALTASTFAVCDSKGSRTEDCAVMFS